MVTATAATAGLAVTPPLAGQTFSTPELREASFYRTLEKSAVQCQLCPRQCVVPNGKRGTCRVRENRNGRYFTLVYGRPCSMNNDPIEKKPLFHVYPGSKAFSIATVGCNIHCKFCQNWEISQASPEDVPASFHSPEDIVQLALKAKARTVAYTYSEPTIFFEYMLDCARSAKQAGLGSVVISNGYINPEPLKELCQSVTAIKIDLKSFSQPFYSNLCGGRLQPVLATLKRIVEAGVWLEIVVLIIPTQNDGMDEIKRMAAWIAKELGTDIPLHFTRFHPAYRLLNLPRTPPVVLQRARETAMAEGCRFVYTGNMPGVKSENTFCPKCGETVVDRYGLTLMSASLKNGACAKCSTAIPGLWS